MSKKIIIILPWLTQNWEGRNVVPSIYPVTPTTHHSPFRFHFSTVDVNECASNPCLNGGSCINRQNRFSCNCLSGYLGSRCENGQYLFKYNDAKGSHTKMLSVYVRSVKDLISKK